MKRLMAILLVWAFFLVPAVFAATPATPTKVSGSTYTPTVDNNLGDINGGWVYRYDLSTEEQTKYWTGIYGTITQSVVLKDAAGNLFFDWTVPQITYSVVYLSEEPSVDFAGTFRGVVSDSNLVTVGVWSTVPTVETVGNTMDINDTLCAYAGITLADGNWYTTQTYAFDGTTRTKFWRTCLALWDEAGDGIDDNLDGVLVAAEVNKAGYYAYDGTTGVNYQALVPVEGTIAYYVWVA